MMKEVLISDEQKQHMRDEISHIIERGKQIRKKMDSNPIIEPFKEPFGDDILRNKIMLITKEMELIEINDDLDLFRKNIQIIYESLSDMYTHMCDVENHYFVSFE